MTTYQSHAYAISLARFLILFELRPKMPWNWTYTNADYDYIAEKIEVVGIVHLKRILVGKSPAKMNALDRLTTCFPPTVSYYGQPWLEFERDVVSDFERREKKHDRVRKPYFDLDEKLRAMVDDAAHQHMLQLLRYIKVSNLPESFPHGFFLKRYKFRRLRSTKEINVIFDFARGVGTASSPYEDAELNGPEIKGPWWERNNNIIHIITKSLVDDELTLADLKANINILPIVPYAYDSLKNGKFKERDLKPAHIITPQEKSSVNHLFVEGLNGFLHATYFLTHMQEIIESVADPKSGLKIGAIVGTSNGEHQMKRFGFEPVGKYIDGVSDFLEVDYPVFRAKIREWLISVSS